MTNTANETEILLFITCKANQL